MSNFDCPHCGRKIHVLGATHSFPNQMPPLEKVDPQQVYMPFPRTLTPKPYNLPWTPKAPTAKAKSTAKAKAKSTAKAKAKSTPNVKAKSNKRRTQRMTKSA